MDGLIEQYDETKSTDSLNILMVIFFHQHHNALKVTLKFIRKCINCRVTNISCLPHPFTSCVNSGSLFNSLTLESSVIKKAYPKLVLKTAITYETLNTVSAHSRYSTNVSYLKV